MRGDGRKGVCALWVSGDARILLSSGEDRTVRVWDVTSGECTAVFEAQVST
jgi:WD40 repeat protein